jgi:hypothetical protein
MDWSKLENIYRVPRKISNILNLLQIQAVILDVFLVEEVRGYVDCGVI